MKKVILLLLLISMVIACTKKKTVYCRFYRPGGSTHPWVQINCDDNPDNNKAVQNYQDGLYREAKDCDECEKIRQGL